MSSFRRNDPPKRPPTPTAELFERQPPFDLDAEAGVLGSMMLLPDVIDDVALLLRPDDFYDDAHRRLYGHMLAMHDAGAKVDPVLLADRLNTAGDYEAVGGAAFLTKIFHAVPNAAHATYYANIVRESHLSVADHGEHRDSARGVRRDARTEAAVEFGGAEDLRDPGQSRFEHDHEHQ